jgi:hypothetical protein
MTAGNDHRRGFLSNRKNFRGVQQEVVSSLLTPTIPIHQRTGTDFPDLCLMSFRVKTPGKTEFSRSDNTRLRLHRLSFPARFQPMDVVA